MLEVIVLIALAGLWGGMLFFASLVAPLVFMHLPPDTARYFIRQIFPLYYLFMGIHALIALIAAYFVSTLTYIDLILLGLTVFGFYYARQIMMPKINFLMDFARANGDQKARAQFLRWHNASVILNLLQMVFILIVLVRMGLMVN